MKKLFLGITLLATASSFASDSIDKKLLDIIELDYNIACEYLETTKPCLINFRCSSTTTYECKDVLGNKKVGVKVIRHAEHTNQLFEILGLKEIRIYQIQNEQAQQPQQAQQTPIAQDSNQEQQIQEPQQYPALSNHNSSFRPGH